MQVNMSYDCDRHAKLLVDHCTDVKEGDMVVVKAPAVATPLTTAIYEQLGERGAMPLKISIPSEPTRAFLRTIDNDALETPQHLFEVMKAADVIVQVGGSTNVAELSDLPAEDMQAFSKINKPLGDAQQDSRWVTTLYPASGNAQKAEMSTSAYQEFVHRAVNRDWAAQREFQAKLVDRLESAETVRIVAGDETDIRMRIDGNRIVNEYAERNMPGGEVYTAPIPDSVEGSVCFDKPVMAMGREIQNARLEFEDGEVIAHDADQNADVLASILGTDEGAKRLGELGIGMNRGIDRFTYNMLFDEKMGDTIHLAVGRSIEKSVRDCNDPNESAIHKDMIVDMSTDSRIELDGDVVQRNGTFVFEEEEDTNTPERTQ
jgi:aminopeptidase